MASVYADKNIVFKETEHEQLKADIYYPTDEKKHPGIVLIHGGAWLQGYKEMYQEWGPYLAEQGYAVMTFDYRLSTPETSTYPEALYDVKSAVQFFIQQEKEWKADKNNIIIIGDSAGGHLATCLTLDKSNGFSYHIAAAICVYGVYNLPDWQQYTNKTRGNDPVFQLIGSSFQDTPERYKEASPYHQVEALEQPCDTSFFLIWGEEDDIVPANQSEAFSLLLEQKGFDVQTLALPGKGHYWFNLFAGIEGGSLKDAPNPLVAANILHYLKRKLID